MAGGPTGDVGVGPAQDPTPGIGAGSGGLDSQVAEAPSGGNGLGATGHAVAGRPEGGVSGGETVAQAPDGWFDGGRSMAVGPDGWLDPGQTVAAGPGDWLQSGASPDAAETHAVGTDDPAMLTGIVPPEPVPHLSSCPVCKRALTPAHRCCSYCGESLARTLP